VVLDRNPCFLARLTLLSLPNISLVNASIVYQTVSKCQTPIWMSRKNDWKPKVKQATGSGVTPGESGKG
jgi:hypothetical protein